MKSTYKLLLVVLAIFGITSTALAETSKGIVAPRCQTEAKADVFRRSVEAGLKSQLFPAGQASCRMKLRGHVVTVGKIELNGSTLSQLFGFSVEFVNGEASLVPINYFVAPPVEEFNCTDQFVVSCTYSSQGARARSFKTSIQVSGHAL